MSRTSEITVIGVHTSPGGIPKTPVETGIVTPDGLKGDGHDHDKHNTPIQAISLMDVEDLNDLAAEGFKVSPGAIGENVTLQGGNIDACSVGDRIRFSGGVAMELTKRRNPCYVLDAIDPTLKTALRGRCGFYAKVLETGTLRPGESVSMLSTASS